MLNTPHVGSFNACAPPSAALTSTKRVSDTWVQSTSICVHWCFRVAQVYVQKNTPPPAAEHSDLVGKRRIVLPVVSPAHDVSSTHRSVTVLVSQAIVGNQLHRDTAGKGEESMQCQPQLNITIDEKASREGSATEPARGNSKIVEVLVAITFFHPVLSDY